MGNNDNKSQRAWDFIVYIIPLKDPENMKKSLYTTERAENHYWMAVIYRPSYSTLFVTAALMLNDRLLLDYALQHLSQERPLYFNNTVPNICFTHHMSWLCGQRGDAL